MIKKIITAFLLICVTNHFLFATDADRETKLGEQYHFGIDVPQDFSKAYNHYVNAANAGSAVAANHLGRMHLNGEGVEKNTLEAKKWYTRSITLDPSVENKCTNGLDSDRALCGLVRAALQKSAPAQYELGLLYQDGTVGLEKNTDKSLFFIKESASQKYEPAIKMLSLIADNQGK